MLLKGSKLIAEQATVMNMYHDHVCTNIEKLKCNSILFLATYKNGIMNHPNKLFNHYKN